MISYDDLTPPERELWAAFPEGRRVDLRVGDAARDDPAGAADWGAERTVRAAVLAALLLGAHPPQPGAIAALRLAGARITGGLDLTGAETAHQVRLEHCFLDEAVVLNSAATASVRIDGSVLPRVDARMARVEGVLAVRRCRVAGALLATNARISGELLLHGTRFAGENGWSVFAGGMEVGGAVFCTHGFTGGGGIRLIGARLSGGLFLDGARIGAADGLALSLDHAQVTTVQLTDGFFAAGRLELRGAQIADLLSFDGAALGGCTGVDGARLHATDLRFTPAEPPAGPVSLGGAQVTVLHDDLDRWPRTVHLDGFAYGSIQPVRAAEQDSVPRRLDWVRRGAGYAPQPYEQLAAWYRQIGHVDDARRVLLAKQRARRRTLRPAGQVWSLLLDGTVGFGYRPWLAGLWLAALTLLGSLVFAAGDSRPVNKGEGPRFHPFVYALDLLIPVGGLGQRDFWYMSGGAPQALSYVLVAAGWLLTTALVAGMTRTLERT
ncbi:oxidoreductase [Streptomyces sp. WMMC500]|uniref:oxidoreductase n=1 Tax=Streptomyces sp. WMMC500 TaxID=3015154 RepID=UPI00248BB5F2|nr:oxidoreductase [Streptomyces sp. WMMC500]WBB60347.1 oxidoreductase [Streptomyces sp. WMMC500]